MARDEHGDRIGTDGVADGAGGLWLTEMGGYKTITGELARRQLEERFPNLKLKVCSSHPKPHRGFLRFFAVFGAFPGKRKRPIGQSFRPLIVLLYLGFRPFFSDFGFDFAASSR